VAKNTEPPQGEKKGQIDLPNRKIDEIGGMKTRIRGRRESRKTGKEG